MQRNPAALDDTLQIPATARDLASFLGCRELRPGHWSYRLEHAGSAGGPEPFASAR